MYLRQLQLARLFSADVEGSGGGTPPTHPKPEVSGTEPQTFSVDYVRELRAENKGYRLKAAELERAANDAKTAAERAMADAKTASDKAAKDAADSIAAHTSKANERLIRAEIRAGAAAAGLAHSDFIRLLDTSAVKVGEDGEVQVPEGFWADAKAKLPHLFAATGADRGTTSNPAPAPKPTPAAGKRAEDLSDADYAAELARLTGRSR